jgi:hypothetical protein
VIVRGRQFLAKMVLNELGQKISQALAMVNNAETIDEKVKDAHSMFSFKWDCTLKYSVE